MEAPVWTEEDADVEKASRAETVIRARKDDVLPL